MTPRLAAELFCMALCLSATGAAAACAADEYQSGEVVLTCNGGMAFVQFTLRKREAQRIASFDASSGIQRLNVSVESDDIDADLELIDEESGECIAGSCSGATSSATVHYRGMEVAYSGDDVDVPVGEQMMVRSALTRTVDFQLYAYGLGTARVAYAWGALSPCPAIQTGCSSCGSYAGCAASQTPHCDGGPVPECLDPTTTSTSTTTTTATYSTTTWSSTSTATSTKTTSTTTLSTTSTRTTSTHTTTTFTASTTTTTTISTTTTTSKTTTTKTTTTSSVTQTTSASTTTSSSMTGTTTKSTTTISVTRTTSATRTTTSSRTMTYTKTTTTSSITWTTSTSATTTISTRTTTTTTTTTSSVTRTTTTGTTTTSSTTATTTRTTITLSVTRTTSTGTTTTTSKTTTKTSTTKTTTTFSITQTISATTTTTTSMTRTTTKTTATKTTTTFSVTRTTSTNTTTTLSTTTTTTRTTNTKTTTTLSITQTTSTHTTTTSTTTTSATSTTSSTTKTTSTSTTFSQTTTTTTMTTTTTSSSSTSSTLTRTTTLLCPADQFQPSAFVLPCDREALSGSLAVQKARGEARVELLRLPAGLRGVRVELSAQGLDTDVLVVDRETQECVLGFRCKYSAACQNLSNPCISSEAALMSFSGIDDTPPVNETVVLFEVRRDLLIMMENHRSGTVTVAFSYAGAFACGAPRIPGCEACSGYGGCAAGQWPTCSGSPRVQCVDNTTTTMTTLTATSTTATTTTATATETGTSSTSTTATATSSTATATTTTATSTTATTSTGTTSTGTTTTSTTSRPGCNRSSSWLGAEGSSPRSSGTTCPAWLEENETCTVTCSEGQAAGQFRCLVTHVVGRPLCVTKDLRYRAESRVAGSFLVLGTLPGGATVESARLPAVLRAMLAGAVGVNAADFASFRVSEPAVKVWYELSVDAPEKLDQVKQDLSALETSSPTASAGVGGVFARSLLYYGFRVSSIQTIIQPTDFQEMTAVSASEDGAKAVPSEYRLSTPVVMGGSVGFMCGLPLLACIIHAVVRKPLRDRCSAAAARGRE